MRLIDANAFEVFGFSGMSEEFIDGVLYVLDKIDEAPAVDAVEVVRCSQCQHFTEGMAVGMCKRNPDKPIIPVPYNHFCSYGVRRSEKE